MLKNKMSADPGKAPGNALNVLSQGSEVGQLHEPVPPSVDLGLDGLHDGCPLLLLEVLEPSLGVDPVHDGLLLGLSGGDPRGLGGQGVLSVDDLVQGPDTGLHCQLGDGDGLVGGEPPSPGAGRDGVDEAGSVGRESLLGLGHGVPPVVGGDLGDVGDVVGDHDLGHVLGELLLSG